MEGVAKALATHMTEIDLKAETAQQLAAVLGLLQIGDRLAALAAAEQVGQWAAHLGDSLTQARILYQLAEILDDAGLPDEAQPRLERSLALSQALDSRLAHLGAGLCLQRLGAIHRDTGRLPESMSCYRQAVEHFQTIGDLVRTGSTWNSLGLVQHRGSNLEAAEDSYRRALAFGQQTGNARLRGTSLGNLGKIALDRYRFAEAEQQLRSAIDLTRMLNDQELLASQVGDLGNVLRAQGRSAEAAHCYEEALRLAEARDDRRGQQLALGNLGALYQERGELSQALLCLERSYAISQAHGSVGDQVADLVHLARLHQALAEPARATERLRIALALAQEAAQDLLAGVLNVLGHLALLEEDLAQAEGYYRQCLAIEERLGDTYNIGSSWLNLGYVARQRGDTQMVLACWQKALELHQAAGNRSGLATAHLNLGGELADQGDFVKAEMHLCAALASAEAFPLPDDARMAWESLALLRWRQGDLSMARDAYEKAIAWAERSRSAIAGQTHRLAFWSTLEGPYLGLIRLCLTMGDNRGAWESVQRARSRTLAELMGGSWLPTPDQLPIEMYQREEELLNRLRQMHSLTTDRPPPEMMAELLEIDATLNSLWMEMHPLASEYVAQRRGEPLRYDEMQGRLVV